jgi:drug/metabolite transporter (DMT)-like permease
MYFSLQYLSLSDAVVLKFIAPILTAFSGAIFLKESLSLKGIIAGICSFFGVILIARPQVLFGGPQVNPTVVVTSRERMISVTAGLIGVLGATASYTLLRAIGKRAHALHVLATFSSQCILVSTIGMIAFKIPPVIPTRALWLLMMFLIGIFGLIAQTLLAMGFQRETASRGTLAMYTSVVFAVVLEFFVFHTTPTLLSISGAIIIMSAAIYTSLTKTATTSAVADPVSERRSLATPVGDDGREAR